MPTLEFEASANFWSGYNLNTLTNKFEGITHDGDVINFEDIAPNLGKP